MYFENGFNSGHNSMAGGSDVNTLPTHSLTPHSLRRCFLQLRHFCCAMASRTLPAHPQTSALSGSHRCRDDVTRFGAARWLFLRFFLYACRHMHHRCYRVEEDLILEDDEVLLSRRFRSRDTLERFASFEDDWLSLRTRDMSCEVLPWLAIGSGAWSLAFVVVLLMTLIVLELGFFACCSSDAIRTEN